MDERDWRREFDRTFAADPDTVGGVQARVWAGVYRDEYPAELGPHSYVSRSELRRFALELRIGPEDLFADLACGEGGPSLWLRARRARG